MMGRLQGCNGLLAFRQLGYNSPLECLICLGDLLHHS